MTIHEAKAKVKLWATVIAAVAGVVTLVFFPAVIVAAGLTYLALRTQWPDRLLALVAVGVGLVMTVVLFWATDYLSRWGNIVSGEGTAADWTVLLLWGVLIGPAIGAVTWRFMQKRREKSPYSGEDEREARLQQEERRRRFITHTAQAVHSMTSNKYLKHVTRPMSVPLGDQMGPFVGRYQRGDLAGPWRAGKAGGIVRVPLAGGEARHVVVLGATGLGKTETTLGMCEWAAREGWQVVYLSCKEPPNPEQSAAPRLAALADGLGSTFHSLIPVYGPFDPMRGSTDDIRDRLVKIEEWGDRYWAHCANLLVGLALDLNAADGKPIGSLPDLVYSLLKSRFAEVSMRDDRVSELIEALEDRALSGALMRYASMALHLREWVAPPQAGGWSFEDADVICAELPTGTRPEAAGALLRLMTRDFGAYMVGKRRQKLANGKPRPVLFVVEEAGAVAGDPVIGKSFVDLVERARSAGVHSVLTAQDTQGLGDERASRAILTNAAVVTYQQTVAAEEVAKLVGTRRTDEGGALYNAAGRVTKEGSTRRQHAMKMSPQMLRELGAGEFVVSARGKFALVAATMTKLGYAIPKTKAVEAVKDQMLLAQESVNLAEDRLQIEKGHQRDHFE